MHKLLPVILFAFIYFGCKVNPADPVFTEEYGKIFISTDVSGAQIFINDIYMGKLTPDTVYIEAGTHKVSVVLEGYERIDDTVFIPAFSLVEKRYTFLSDVVNRVVLLEDFANVSCIPCVTSNQIIENLKNKYSSKEFIAVKYATNFPSSYDPFYLFNKDLMNARMSYYNIIQAPTIIINGNLKPIATDSISIENKIIQEKNSTADFFIGVVDTIINNVYKITATIYKIKEGINLSNLVIKSLAIEEQINFSTPPGQSGELEFHNVVRYKFNEVSGDILANSSKDNPYVFTSEISLNPTVNAGKLNAVVYIQELITKKVYQTGSTF